MKGLSHNVTDRNEVQHPLWTKAALYCAVRNINSKTYLPADKALELERVQRVLERIVWNSTGLGTRNTVLQTNRTGIKQ